MSNENYDYTQEQAAAKISADSYVMPDFATVDRTADEIEAENGFDEIEPGTYEIELVRWGELKRVAKELYVNKQRITVHTYETRANFCLPDERGKQVGEYLLLPPSDPDQYNAWKNGSKKPDAKSGGFWGNKYFHLLERLFAIVIPKGSAPPPHTRSLSNWVGRRVVATIESGNSYTRTIKDTDTGMEKEEEQPGRNQVKLYSWRATSEAMANYRRPAADQAQQPSLPGVSAQRPATKTNGAAAPLPRASIATPAVTPQARPTTPAVNPVAAQIAMLNKAMDEAAAAGDYATAGDIQAQIGKIHAGAARGPAPAQQTRPAPQRQPAMAGTGNDRGLGDI